MEVQKELHQMEYAMKFLDEVSRTALDATVLPRIVDVLKSITISASGDDIKVYDDRLSSLGVAKILLEVTRSVLKLGFNAETWPSLHALRSACISLSDRFESFCADFGSTGFLASPANELRRYVKANFSENATIEFLVDSALALLGNCAKVQSVVKILWEMKMTEVLLTYANSSVRHIRIQALLLLGLLSADVEHGSVLLNDEQVSAIHHVLTEASSNASLSVVLGNFMMSAAEVLQGINGLALNKQNAALLVRSGVLAPLTKILSIGSTGGKQVAVDFLWTLAIGSGDKEQFVASKELRQSLESLLQAEPDLTTAVKCVLLQIGWNPLEEVSDTLMYVECAYQQKRYEECVRVCDAVCEDPGTKYSEQDCSCLKLIAGKSLCFMLENYDRFLATDLEESKEIRGKQKAVIAERVVRILGPLVDNGRIDKDGTRSLDIAMMHCVRESNSLGKRERCLLCHSRGRLQSSHVMPKFVLAGFSKGMKRSATKKDYLIKGVLGDKEEERTPKLAAWFMLCRDCEQKLSSQGESPFARKFFQEVYKISDPSSPVSEHCIPYSGWLYQFAVGIIFRSLAVNPKGISGFMNDDEVYKLFTQCRKLILKPDELPADHPQVAVFVNPRSCDKSDFRATSTINRILNMPSFLYLVENDEKLGYCKTPRIANFFLAHFGILNFTVSFPRGDFSPPREFCINTKSGSFTIPDENQRMNLLPQPVRESLNFAAEQLEAQDMKISLEHMQGLKVYESSPKVPEAEETVFGLAEAKQKDKELIKKIGFQPSSDPRFPKEFNLLPPAFNIHRKSESKDFLQLPTDHKLLFHWTLSSEDTGVTFFLCTSCATSDRLFQDRPYIIVHRFMPGLHLNFAFFVSSKDLTPEELLPDKNPKVYADALLSEYQSRTTLQSSFFRLLSKVGVSLQDILNIKHKESEVSVKCIPSCWFCEGRCDACSTPADDSVSVYGQKFSFCSKKCLLKLVKPSPAITALPSGFTIRNEFRHFREVSLPDGHTLVTHFSTPFNSESNTTGELTIFLCKADQALENRPYILCHFHSLVEQFSVALFISGATFQPLETLPGTPSCDEAHRFYLESLYTTGIVQMILLHALHKHNESSIENLLSRSENRSFRDKKCNPPCWYCVDRCSNCFVTCTSEYCSDSCRITPQNNPPHLFSSIPESFVVSRSFKEDEPSLVILPNGHRCLFHAIGTASKPNGTVASEMTIILCMGDGSPPYYDQPYVIFQHYNVVGNKLANVGFYVSPDDLSIQEPLCTDDVAAPIFISRLQSDCNVPEGIEAALERRGFSSMAALLEQTLSREVFDIKCSPPCWYCKYRCDICLKQTDVTTDINGESIRHCSNTCLEKLLANPGIIHLLPQGFSIRSSQNCDECLLQLPDSHQAILHVHCDYLREDGRNGNYLLILCISTKAKDETPPASTPYVLYHQFNSLRQITFGFYIATDSLEPSQPLVCEKPEHRLKCLRYLQQVAKLEPIANILRTKLEECNAFPLKPEELPSIEDKPCAVPLSCWYCKKMNLI